MDGIYRTEDLEEFVLMERNLGEVKSVHTPLDLYRYKSLRFISIMYAVGYFLEDICYVSHLAAADKIGVNP